MLKLLICANKSAIISEVQALKLFTSDWNADFSFRTCFKLRRHGESPSELGRLGKKGLKKFAPVVGVSDEASRLKSLSTRNSATFFVALRNGVSD
jgi:hypothetical protein